MKCPNRKRRKKTGAAGADASQGTPMVLTYTGSHIVRAYRKRFKVDVSCALNDLETVNAPSPEKLETLTPESESNIYAAAHRDDDVDRGEFRKQLWMLIRGHVDFVDFLDDTDGIRVDRTFDFRPRRIGVKHIRSQLFADSFRHL